MDQQGVLTVDTENIEEVKVKYYLVDVEILFSRYPFIFSKADQFSYVMPYRTVNAKTNAIALANNMGFASAQTKVPLPDDLVGKNVIIEINSDDQQKF